MTPEAQITAEELQLIVERGGEQGVLEAEEEQMINAVIELGEQPRPRGDGPADRDRRAAGVRELEEAIDRVVDEGHSRIPVYEDVDRRGRRHPLRQGPAAVPKADAAPRPSLRSLLRAPVFVPESMSIDDLLHEFQRRKVHIAIVLDEYGGTAGLVTIEDLLEEIVGEIQDEYDTEEPMVVRCPTTRPGSTAGPTVDDLAELFDLRPRRSRTRTSTTRSAGCLPPDRRRARGRATRSTSTGST